MTTLIVHTDFSASSHNALAYACDMVRGKDVQLVLLHVYTIPAMVTSDGVALTTISNSFTETEDLLEEEVEWVHEEYPSVRITSKAVLGSFMESLREQVKIVRPALLIMGAAVHSDDLWSFDAEILDAFIDLDVPVLTVPKSISYTHLRQVCFSCNLKYITRHTPFEAVKSILQLTGTKLHVIFVVPPAVKEAGTTGHPAEPLVRQAFEAFTPVYHLLSEGTAVNDMGQFIKDEQIDLLLVIPRRQGIYDSLFHKSNTKALARINDIPVLALREQ